MSNLQLWQLDNHDISRSFYDSLRSDYLLSVISIQWKLSIPNALLLPHIGYVTAENYSVFYTQMFENLESCVSGKPIRVIK